MMNIVSLPLGDREEWITPFCIQCDHIMECDYNTSMSEEATLAYINQFISILYTRTP
jgi:hypothetical protein